MGNYTKSGKIPVGGRKKKRSVAGTRALQLYRNSIRTIEVVNTVPLNHELLSATDSDHESLKTTTINDIENEELSELCVETEIKEINATEIKGRRVVDIMYLFKALKSLKHDGFSCSFFDMDIINEKRVGFESIFTIKCLVCNLVTYIHTECPELKESYMNINAAATNAIVTTGGGYRQLTAFCSALDIPSISSATYYKYQNKLFVAINDVAREEMKLAGEEEARLAKERGDVDANGNPVITVVADGAWSKRSYRTNYNALSGVACIVGLATKKVLYIGVKNRYCMICDSNIFREKKDHFCYKNWNKAATGMEAAAIVEGFCSSMELHGLVYGRLVGDGDSSVYRKINEILPYGTQTIVQKVECTNHILRNYLSKLRDLKSKVGTSVEDRNYIINNIMRFRNALTSAIKYRNSQTMLTVEEKTNLLEKDILNSPYHILGSHSNCDKYFCKRADNNEINLVPRFEENGLIEDILKCIKRVADNSCSLLYECNNNIAEQYNSYVAQFVSGKRINYSLRGSYAARCHAAVTAYNTDGQLVRKVNEAYTGNSAGY